MTAKNREAGKLDVALAAIEEMLQDRMTSRRAAAHYEVALERVAVVRAELSRCPEGEPLAAAVLLMMASMNSALNNDATITGLFNAAKSRRKNLDARYDPIRKAAATLDPDLSKSAKAKILEERFGLSADRIRRKI